MRARVKKLHVQRRREITTKLRKKVVTLRLDVDIQGHGIELAPISNLSDFDIDIEPEFCCLDVHDIDIWNSHERLNSEACLDGHSLHWNCTLM